MRARVARPHLPVPAGPVRPPSSGEKLIKYEQPPGVWGGGDGDDIATQQLGSGLYTALASYFNSAPNTVWEMVLVAACDIQQGEEITEEITAPPTRDCSGSRSASRPPAARCCVTLSDYSSL